MIESFSELISHQYRILVNFSNAIGSNVFDIDLGIGAPFLLFSLIKGQPMPLMKLSEWVRFLINL